jgi:nucleoid-associated protein YgaU
MEPEPVPEPVAVPEPAVDEPAPEPYVEEPSPMAVPADSPAAVEEPESEFTEYVVVSGDTLGKISKKVFGTTAKWKKIAEFNGITNPRLLKVGMTLRIPKDL